MTSDSPDYIKVIEVTQPDVSVQVNPIIMSEVCTGIPTGSKTCTTAGTAYQLTATATPIYGVIVKARRTNAGAIYVGDATSQNLQLSQSEGITLPIDDLSKVYVKADNNGDVAYYLYLTRA